MTRLTRIILLAISAAALSGCNTYLMRHAPPESVPPALTPVGMDVYYAPYKGTLWQERGREADLFADHIARRINDIVHVEIVEESEAIKEAATETSKKTTSKAGAPNAFGLLAAFASQNHWFMPNPMLEAELSKQYEGEGSTARKGKLNAKISARIIELLPNRHYRLEGRQRITVNNEEQYIVVQGVIREEDVRPDNTVLSTHIADQKIWYTGRGLLAEKQRPSWLGPIFDIFWPF